MIYNYTIDKLCCSACATKIENDFVNLGYIQGTIVNEETNTVRIEATKEPDINILKAIVDKVEKGASIYPIENNVNHNDHSHDHHDHNHEHGEVVSLKTMLICGVFFAFGLIIEHIFGEELQNEMLNRMVMLVCYAMPYAICGQMVLLEGWKSLLKKDYFNEFTLMSGATLAAIIIGHFGEAVGVMLFYCIGEYVQDKAAGKSRNSIKSLLATKPTIAHTCDENGNNVQDKNPEQVQKGEYVLVKAGEKFPLDGEVVDGTSYMDTAPLTGEPLPVLLERGTLVLAGCINKDSSLVIKVTKNFKDTSIARILEMVENANGRKSPTERLITRLARYYTPIVVIIAALIALLPPILFNASFSEWLYKALVLLVVSCPCALIISIPLAYFGGIGAASKKGILIKGGYVLDALQKIKIVAFDKTGTLTKGTFSIVQVDYAQNSSIKELLDLAGLAESRSNHPLAKAVVNEAIKQNGKLKVALNLQTKEILGKGITANCDKDLIHVGTWDFLAENNTQNLPSLDEIQAKLNEEAKVGSHILISLNNEYKGFLIAADTLRPEAKDALDNLRFLGVKTLAMLTGDNEYGAKIMAKKLDLDIVKSRLLPEDKASALESIGNVEESLFMGDGINDAPVLATAGVGVAMGGLGSEAAIETADVVVLDDNPSRVADLLLISEATKKIVWQNIFMAISIKLLFISLGLVGVSGLWEAVFADVGVAVMAVLNASRIMR